MGHKRKDKAKCLYLYLHKRMAERLPNCHSEVSYDDVWNVICRSKIPWDLFYMIIREMENMQLLKKVSRHKLRVINIERNKLLNNRSQIEYSVGLW